MALAVAARYGRDAPAISGGLIWRVYAAKADATGVFRLIKEDRGAAPTFILPPGSYVVHASLGLASAAKAIQLRADTVREMFDIPAGGVRLEGRVGDVRIPPGQIAFDIYPGSQFDTSSRRPVAQNVITGDVVLLPEGTYYIVSNYGEANSVVRSDVRVQAAKLTDIVVTHRAAALTFKLVNDAGGEALANTQWTVLTPGGDVIKEIDRRLSPRRARRGRLSPGRAQLGQDLSARLQGHHRRRRRSRGAGAVTGSPATSRLHMRIS